MTIYLGATIYHTHGDTLFVQVGLQNPDGTPYATSAGDKVRFILRKEFGAEPVLTREIPLDTLVLTMSAAETKALGQGIVNGHYVYDVELTKADGLVDTVIQNADIYFTEEA